MAAPVAEDHLTHLEDRLVEYFVILEGQMNNILEDFGEVLDRVAAARLYREGFIATVDEFINLEGAGGVEDAGPAQDIIERIERVGNGQKIYSEAAASMGNKQIIEMESILYALLSVKSSLSRSREQAQLRGLL